MNQSTLQSLAGANKGLQQLLGKSFHAADPLASLQSSVSFESLLASQEANVAQYDRSSNGNVNNNRADKNAIEPQRLRQNDDNRRQVQQFEGKQQVDVGSTSPQIRDDRKDVRIRQDAPGGVQANKSQSVNANAQPENNNDQAQTVQGQAEQKEDLTTGQAQVAAVVDTGQAQLVPTMVQTLLDQGSDAVVGAQITADTQVVSASEFVEAGLAGVGQAQLLQSSGDALLNQAGGAVAGSQPTTNIHNVAGQANREANVISQPLSATNFLVSSQVTEIQNVSVSASAVGQDVDIAQPHQQQVANAGMQQFVQEAKEFSRHPQAANQAADGKEAAAAKVDGEQPASHVQQPQQSNSSQHIQQQLSPLAQALSGQGKQSQDQQGGQQQSQTSNIAGIAGKLNTGSGVKTDQFLDRVQTMNERLTTNRFGDAKQVMAQIKFGVANQVGKADKITVQLFPKDLGRVEIQMQQVEDGKTHVKVMAERAETLNIMQKETDSLSKILQDSLKTQSANLSFSFQENDQQQFSGEGGNSSLVVAQEEELADEELVLEAGVQPYQIGQVVSLDSLDIKV